MPAALTERKETQVLGDNKTKEIAVLAAVPELTERTEVELLADQGNARRSVATRAQAEISNIMTAMEGCDNKLSKDERTHDPCYISVKHLQMSSTGHNMASLVWLPTMAVKPFTGWRQIWQANLCPLHSQASMAQGLHQKCFDVLWSSICVSRSASPLTDGPWSGAMRANMSCDAAQTSQRASLEIPASSGALKCTKPLPKSSREEKR